MLFIDTRVATIHHGLSAESGPAAKIALLGSNANSAIPGNAAKSTRLGFIAKNADWPANCVSPEGDIRTFRWLSEESIE